MGDIPQCSVMIVFLPVIPLIISNAAAVWQFARQSNTARSACGESNRAAVSLNRRLLLSKEAASAGAGLSSGVWFGPRAVY